MYYQNVIDIDEVAEDELEAGYAASRLYSDCLNLEWAMERIREMAEGCTDHADGYSEIIEEINKVIGENNA